MLPWLDCANPSSPHREGRRARQAIDEARLTVADSFSCLPGEIVFTSSGTEAANLAMLGAARKSSHPDRKRILLGSTEHHCVLHTRPHLERLGFEVELVPAMDGGWIDPDAVRKLIGGDVLLVSVMHANNETGAINDAAAIAEICREAGALYHCDAVHTAGYLPLRGIGADLVCISAHKIYGPKGAGALYVRAGTPIEPMVVGGGQEREMRAGTEDVAAIVGLAAAIQCLGGTTNASEARNAFVERIRANSPQAILTALGRGPVLPGHAHLRIPGASAESMLIRLDAQGIAASSGAACTSGSLEPSHVLIASGLSEKVASEGLRFTFGKGSKVDEAVAAADAVSVAAREILAARPSVDA
jgi:cysteine desulfurase